MKNKKVIFIIIISIFLILAIASSVFAYLFIATDIFRSSQELFGKYFTQNIDAFQKMADLKTFETYNNLQNENNYESNTIIKTVHSEGGEISNPLNGLSAKLNMQKDGENQYVYIDGQILYEDEKYLETELIKEEDTYGIRFTDAVKQFVTIKKDENAENIVNEIGINPELLEIVLNLLNGNEQQISTEQIKMLKDNCWNAILNEVQSATFDKQKNVEIESNNLKINTNAYSMSLTSEQVKKVLVEVLNNIKNEIKEREELVKSIDETITEINEKEDIPTVKITVFEEKQKTILTKIDVGINRIIIENTENVEEIITNIKYSNTQSEFIKEYSLQIVKKNSENQENVQIVLEVKNGEENYTIALSNNMQFIEGELQFDAEISHKQDITTMAIQLQNRTTIGNEFEKINLSEPGTNILMNTLEETKRKQIIDLLKVIVPQKIIERINLLNEKIEIKEENNMTQVEINKFNAKFEFYAGEEISSENLKALLEIVKNNLGSCEIITNEQEENSDNVTENIKLNIEKDIINEAEVNKIIEKIQGNKKYKVSISYEQSNGLIDYITITQN